MKRIVTHLLVAAGLAAGACGVAQAHTDLSVGLSLGVPAPVYVQPGPAYAQPVYYPQPAWDHGYYGPDHRGWDHGDRRYGHGNYRDDHRSPGWHG
ncbi:MAG: hypothetical protein WCA85_33040 [Paraburkholderia sp.]|uniref:hypothetical protein n=1 Tax=Paraburkholderia sp. TaxID=1926495 RepID=UPI003C541373